MTVWFTADLHFGHRNVSRYCGRPFPDTDDGVREMDDALVRRWNERVDPRDQVWVLGDVALGRIATSLPRVAQLHGTLHLVAGNHDRCWGGHDDARGVAAARERYAEVGFVTIDDVAELELDDRTVRLSHFPYWGDSHAEDRFASLRPVDDGTWLLHGHVHTTWRQHAHQVNVGVDAWGGHPVAAADVIALIDAGPRDLPPLPWPAP